MIIVIILFYLDMDSHLFSSDLILDNHGKGEVKVYKIDNNNFSWIILRKRVLKTNSYIFGNSEVLGFTEIYEKKVVLILFVKLRI